MRSLASLLLALLLAASLPAAAQDLLSGESKSESSMDVLQKLLLGKIKEKSATTTEKAAPGTEEHLPRKASGTGSASSAAKDAAQDGQSAKPTRTSKPRPTRQADFHPLPRLKPAAPISASPTIQLPKPVPMPATP